MSPTTNGVRASPQVRYARLPVDGVRVSDHGLMEIRPGLAIDDAALDAFCRRQGIRRLALFGSVLRPDFRSDSDIDVLVFSVSDSVRCRNTCFFDY